jgi:hypothetical protein
MRVSWIKPRDLSVFCMDIRNPKNLFRKGGTPFALIGLENKLLIIQINNTFPSKSRPSKIKTKIVNLHGKIESFTIFQHQS